MIDLERPFSVVYVVAWERLRQDRDEKDRLIRDAEEWLKGQAD